MDFLEDGAQCDDPVYLKVAGADLMEIFPLNYNVKTLCALCGSPSENGMTQYDNKVIKPVQISFSGVIKYTQYEKLDNLRDSLHSIDEGMLCTFYSKGQTMEHMLIESFEEVGDNTRFDGIEVRVSLVEYLEHNNK